MIAAFITWDPDTMKQAGLNTVLGIGIVFIVLILISFIISLFKYINKIGAPKKEEVKVAAPAPVEVVEEDVTDDLEIVAVITAAITAYEESMGGSAEGLVVRSIKKVNKKWLNA